MDVSSALLFFFLLSSVSGLILPLTKPNGDADLSSLINHVTMLEQTMTSLQTQVQTTNSKLQATEIELTTVKANLQMTEDELKVVKSDLKSAETEIAILKNDLQKSPDPVELTNLKSEFDTLNALVLQINLTVIDSVSRDVKSNKREIQSLNTRQNNTEKDLTTTKSEVQTAVSDVKTVQSQVNSISGDVNTLNQEVKGVKNQNDKDVAFQVTQRVSGYTKGWSILKFDTVDYNTGVGYDNSTGMFTAPLSGTYIFWANVLHWSPNNYLYTSIYKGQQILAQGYYMMSDDNIQGVTSSMTVTHLDKGEQVHFTTDTTKEYIYGYGDSSYGGALLYAV